MALDDRRHNRNLDIQGWLLDFLTRAHLGHALQILGVKHEEARVVHLAHRQEIVLISGNWRHGQGDVAVWVFSIGGLLFRG